MSLSWKDIVATISMVLVAGLTVALTTGVFDDIESRWALGTFAIFLIGIVTGLITGTAKMMQRVWSSVSLYILSIGIVAITVVNAFLDSGVWFGAMVVAYALIWLEFIGVDLFSPVSKAKDTTRMSRGGTV